VKKVRSAVVMFMVALVKSATVNVPPAAAPFVS